MTSPRATALAVCSLLACANAARTDAWRASIAAGDRAFTAGRTREAAGHFERAAGETGDARDRLEALYRAANAYDRAGEHDRSLALYDQVARASREFDRGARAVYEAARIRREHGDAHAREESDRALDTLIRTWPETGPARRAVTLRLRDLDASDPTRARSIAWLDALLRESSVTGSSLRESVLAERAQRFEDGGRPDEALAAWEELVALLPYPQNSRWDDAHMAIARLRRAAGDPREAIAALERMLSVRERPHSGGSYDAPRFIDGAMLRGEILRDDVRDLAAAARAFHDVYTGFTTSRRRDDALWAEAETRVRLADGSACGVWIALAREFPCTRRGRGAAEQARACGETVPAPAPEACD